MGEVGYIARAGAWRVLFLLPDGVRDVTLSLQDGTSRAVNVANNLVSVLTKAQPDALSFQAADGSRQQLDLSTVN
jgi:hypothetical protein